MHTLFLGLVEYHIRQILGIDDDEMAEEPIDPVKLVVARDILANNPTQSQLKQVTIPVLKSNYRQPTRVRSKSKSRK